MNPFLNILDLDGSYLRQNFYKKVDYNILNLRDMTGTRSFCDNSSLKKLDSKFHNSNLGPMTFIGSGDFHYITYLLLRNIDVEFDLIVLDNHLDLVKPSFINLISCGSWILNAIDKIKNLKRILIIGAEDQYHKYISDELKDKVQVIYHSKLLLLDINSFIKNYSQGRNIYLSIDKDVFSEKYVHTNWNQGVLNPYILDQILRGLKFSKLIGLDICGEYFLRPGHELDIRSLNYLKMNSQVNNFILNKILDYQLIL